MELGFKRTPILTLLIIMACGSFSLAKATAEEVTQSPNDVRQYDSFVLPNQLKVLVISDPSTDKAAAALDVFIGSGSDPADREGLAHFLEHMLFLGTEKYPNPGDYQAFINAHGGSHNAYTSFEHTNYYFDIDKNHLQSTLDRFSQFFTAPLFTADYVAREKNAVHAEYSLRLKDDGRRELDARRRALNPNHPYAKFSVGSLETLADRPGRAIRDDLIEFYKRHYSANLMTLVVLGKEPTERLKQWVTERFSAVKNTHARPLQISEPLFEDRQPPIWLDVKPVKEKRVLKLTFPIPPVTPYYLSKPGFFIGNLLGHEGKGSLLSLLKAKGWSDGLSAGLELNHRQNATFTVSIALTQKGVEQVADIGAYVFDYLRLIDSEDGLAKWRFDEQQQLGELDFNFQEKYSPIDYVRTLANELQRYPARDVLRARYAMEHYDPELIRRYLAELTPDKVLVTLIAQEVKTDSETKRFKTPYRIQALDRTILERWRKPADNPMLALPQRNNFIPDNLAIRSAKVTAKVPELLQQCNGVQLWFQQDETYRVPRADFYFTVRSPYANDTPRHNVLTNLYVKIVNDQLNEFVYPAQLAGLSFNLYAHVRGFAVRLSGYDDKQALLLARITEVLHNPEIKPEQFAILKNELLENLRNARKESPYRQALAEIRDLLTNPSWAEEKRIEALKPLNSTDLKTFIPKLFSEIDLVALSHGNVDAQGAVALSKVLESELTNAGQGVPVPHARVVRLVEGANYRRPLSIDNNDSTVVIYYQGRDKRETTRARFELLAQLLSAPFYEQLRTQKQLGYAVFASALPILDIPGLVFVIQSPTTGPAELQENVEAFLENYWQSVQTMSEDQMQKLKQAVLINVLEEEVQLSERTNRYWTELDLERYDFDSKRRLADAVRSTTLKDFAATYQDVVLDERGGRLIVTSTGGKHRENVSSKDDSSKKTFVIDDPYGFKKHQQYFAITRSEIDRDASIAQGSTACPQMSTASLVSGQ